MTQLTQQYTKHGRSASDWEEYKRKLYEVKSKVQGLKKREDERWGEAVQVSLYYGCSGCRISTLQALQCMPLNLGYGTKTKPYEDGVH